MDRAKMVSPACTTRPEVETTQQIVEEVIKPFCDLITAKDNMDVGFVCEGIANILATAEKLNETDKIAIMVDESEGLDKFEQLQSHENGQI